MVKTKNRNVYRTELRTWIPMNFSFGKALCRDRSNDLILTAEQARIIVLSRIKEK